MDQEGDQGTSYHVSHDDVTDVTRVTWLPGAVCGIEDAQAVDAEIHRVVEGKVLVLVDLRVIDSIDRPAREYFMDRNAHYRAVAMVAGSASTRMLANFFLGLKRGSIPVKMFTDEAAAVAWLREQA